MPNPAEIVLENRQVNPSRPPPDPKFNIFMVLV
jgi:hypothetical protein